MVKKNNDFRQTKRTYRCTLCRGTRRVMTRYTLYTCGRCFIKQALNMGWYHGR